MLTAEEDTLIYSSELRQTVDDNYKAQYGHKWSYVKVRLVRQHMLKLTWFC
jgi:hypothetical protein